MSEKSISTEKPSTPPTKPSPYTGMGTFSLIGDDADIVGKYLSEFLVHLCTNHNIEVVSYNYGFYFNHKGETNALKLKKAEHPNEGGKDSFSVRSGT